VESGANPAPVVPPSAGAEALWTAMARMDRWPERDVLVLTTRGGGTMLADELRRAGARVHLVEAYRVRPRDPGVIRHDWQTADPDAVVVGSGRSAQALIDAIGSAALIDLRAVVALGDSAAKRLSELRVAFRRAPEASFEAAAEMVASLLIDGERVTLRGDAP
jgi:uroporphyrinogen-III synthase